MTISEQLCLLPEGGDERRAPLHRAQAPAGATLEIAEIAGAEVRHGVVLQVAPDVFNGIELWGVGGQILQGDLRAQALEILFDQSRAMRLQAIPYDQESAADRLVQGLKELHHLRALDRAGEEAVLQHRRLALRRPGACAAGSLGQTRLVNEDDYSALPRGDFFIAGHLLSFQVRMAASSRCRARPVGRCTLHPNCCSSLQTEDCENCTPKRSLISMPMRGSVHSSLVKPAANAPLLRASISSVRCASLSLGGRPKRCGRFRAAMPPRSCNFVHRNTDCRVTPTRRATSAGHTPALSSRMPCLRRF